MPTVQPAALLTRTAGERFDLELPDGKLLALAWCPPGTFLMGSPKSEKNRGRDERQHEVRLTKGLKCAP